MHKFPSIEQYRHAVREATTRARYAGKQEDGTPIYAEDRVLPTLTFRGTVKIHGTNAAIVREAGEVYYQSRERKLSLEFDNAGFMAAMQSQPVDALINQVLVGVGVSPAQDPTVCIYGEWCGKGIQKNVAISELSKRFVIFAIKVDDTWVDFSLIPLNLPGSIFYSAFEFPNWEIEIDIENPMVINNRLVELTQMVEDECPVAKCFGVSGIGEGIVWWCTTPGYRDIRFKVKGEKHSVSKVKTLASVDVEKITTLNEFVARTVTDERLTQGLHVLQTELLLPFEMTSLGEFIRWVFNDVMKEEADTIFASGFERKDLGSPIAGRSRKWFVEELNKQKQFA